MEHGPGTLVKVTKKKRGWSPASLQFHDNNGDKTTVILRLKGKEMGTPWLYKDPAWVAPSTGLDDSDRQDEDELMSSLHISDSDGSDDDGGDLSLFLESQADDEIETADKVQRARARSTTFSSYKDVVQANYQSLKTPRLSTAGGSIDDLDSSPTKKNRKRAKAVVAKRAKRGGAVDEPFVLRTYEKSDDEREFLLSKLRDTEFMLQFFLRADLSEDQQSDLVKSMRPVVVQAEEHVVEQGSHGTTAYIIQTGAFDCIKKMSRKEYCGLRTSTIQQVLQQHSPSGEIDETTLREVVTALKVPLSEVELDAALTEMAGGRAFATNAEFATWFAKSQELFHVYSYSGGGCFGELALLYDEPRAATIIASEPSKLWEIDIVTYKNIVVNGNSARTGELKQIIQRVEQFSSLGPEELQNMADALKTEEFFDGQKVIGFGDPCNDDSKFYIIDTGEAIVEIPNKEGVMSRVATLTEGKYFGELAILNDEPRKATIVASGPLKCLVLSRTDFHRILGDLTHLLATKDGGATADASTDRMTGTVAKFDDSLEADFEGMDLSQDDFEVFGVLGKGSFGLVSHIRAKKGKRPGSYYAMKEMSKAALIEMDQVSHIMNEKKVMNMCVHPLIVNLHGCFQDDSSLYMVMEYIKGGELYSVMNKEGTLSNDHARFYAAEILEALVFLHSKVRKNCHKEQI